MKSIILQFLGPDCTDRKDRTKTAKYMSPFGFENSSKSYVNAPFVASMLLMVGLHYGRK